MKKILLKTCVTIFIAVVFLSPISFAKADACSNFKNLFNIGQQGSGVDTTSLTTQVPVFCSAPEILTWATNLLLGLAGSAAVLFIILGGYQYITAGGNDEAAEKARKIITNSVIGLVVIIMSYTIVQVVVNTLVK